MDFRSVLLRCGVLCLCLSLATAESVVIEPLRFENDQWVFLEKFVFDSQGGQIELKALPAIDIPGQENVVVAWYHDLPEGIHSVINSGMSCARKLSFATKIVNVTETLGWEHGMEGDVMKSYVSEVFGMRPHYWYFFVANCHSENIALEKLDLSLTNSPGRFTEQFSHDEYGIYETSILNFAILTLLLIWIVYSIITSKPEVVITPPQSKFFVLMSAICVSEWFSTLMTMSYYTEYANTGTGEEEIFDVALFLDLICVILMTSVLLFISKGWLITSARIVGRRTLLETLVVYSLVSVVLFAWSLRDVSPVNSDYLYSTPPGTVLVLLRVWMTLMFLRNMHTTWHSQEGVSLSRGFLLTLTLFGGGYLISVPFLVIIASAADDWNRKKIVICMELCIASVAYLALMIMFRPGSPHLRQASDPVFDAPIHMGIKGEANHKPKMLVDDEIDSDHEFEMTEGKVSV